MKVLVVYDSVYGNTEKVARAIGEALVSSDKVKVLTAGKVSLSDLNSVDILIVGSPTHGGRPTPETTKFLNSLKPDSLKGIRVASFDTGISSQGKGVGLKLLVRVFGYAASRIAKELEAKGGKLAVPPEGFFVEGREGPLKDGELKRASGWAKKIRSLYH